MLINGVAQTKLDASDRGLSYGDGLFETIRLYNGKYLYLEFHLKRLISGCRALSIHCDFELLSAEMRQLSKQFSNYDVLKIIVTRGSGGRGYRPIHSQQQNATRILSLHKLPDDDSVAEAGGVHTFLCKQHVAQQNTLAGIKHLNRLEQVLASLEWPSDNYQEGIMLDQNGNVIEGTKSNIFFAEGDKLITPSLNSCGINGVMRKVIIDAFKEKVSIEQCSLQRVLDTDELFVCNSVVGVWPVLSLKTEQKIRNYRPAQFCQQALAVFDAGLKENVK